MDACRETETGLPAWRYCKRELVMRFVWLGESASFLRLQLADRQASDVGEGKSRLGRRAGLLITDMTLSFVSTPFMLTTQRPGTGAPCNSLYMPW